MMVRERVVPADAFTRWCASLTLPAVFLSPRAWNRGSGHWIRHEEGVLLRRRERAPDGHSERADRGDMLRMGRWHVSLVQPETGCAPVGTQVRPAVARRNEGCRGQ